MILAAALLEILSILPAKETVRTDETFTFTVRVRNAGPDAAEGVKLRAGANATGLILGITGPPEWTCDAAGPRFATVTTCTTAAMPAHGEAAFTVTMTAPQPSAMTYRVGASVTAKGVTAKKLETNLVLVPSDAQAELSMSARKLDEERATFEVRNDGPEDAREVLVVIAGAALAGGDGWKCEPAAHGVVCTRPALAAGTAASLEARGTSTARMEAQVRAEQILEEQPRDNAVRP